jgi:quinol monooxygenase YgiN
MVIATVKVLVPGEKLKEALQVVRLYLGPVCVQPGCISSRLYQDVNDPKALTLFEEWKSREDLDHHLRSNDYRKILALMELSSEPPEIRFNSVSHLGGLGVIEEARSLQPFKH